MLKCLFTLSMIALLFTASAQTPASTGPQAEAFYNKAMPVLKPSYKSVVLQSAAGMKGRTSNSDSLVKALMKEPALVSLSQQDIQALALLVMLEADKSTQKELVQLTNEMRGNIVKKQAIRKQVQADSSRNKDLKKDALDALSDLEEEQQTRMGMISDRRQKANTMISNLMKKISDAEEQIIRNFK